jgi:hypothetical protein
LLQWTTYIRSFFVKAEKYIQNMWGGIFFSSLVCILNILSKKHSWINISSHYKNNLKSPKILTAWAGNVAFALAHSDKCGLHISMCFA